VFEAITMAEHPPQQLFDTVSRGFRSAIKCVRDDTGKPTGLLTKSEFWDSGL
jgi:hypothetical protein